MGIVEEVGEGVTLLKKGDRVVVPFNVADGRCRNCEEGKTAFCTGVNPGIRCHGSRPYRGGQAQYLRVPYADFNALQLPPGKEHESGFILLAVLNPAVDIFPTGWHGVELSGFTPGESIAVFGAGPVGLMAGYSAVLRGDSRVFVVDRVPERLQVAEAIGCIPVDLTKSDAVEQIIEVNNGMVDRSVDAPFSGYSFEFDSDPGAPDTAAAKGMISLSFGKLFEKGLKLATGQCSVKAYNRYLRDLIIAGKAKPSFVVSHEITLDDVEVTYDRFDKRLEGIYDRRSHRVTSTGYADRST
ncbi:hypothetical protein MAC_07880 [Metarhizium acridum CQMa 102]|uniref:Alcohol dehydrogenase-like N-terminal domain-containing protein n=1 Tax=Metarhizium acridum (strain CQMa 102) TaxID=655827 RepID=E9EDD2_METAQ|nr:uncharacterized protein MAC_07880 [Metarhizium acridum CQMa 102]EFY86072.1 hypothetical protein MAC_07880 [Metarhizium acridum CQMa 102]